MRELPLFFGAMPANGEATEQALETAKDASGAAGMAAKRIMKPAQRSGRAFFPSRRRNVNRKRTQRRETTHEAEVAQPKLV